MKIETLAVHAGQKPDKEFGAVVPPLYTTSTFAQSSPGEFATYDYARAGNPTRSNFEMALAALEGGTDAFAFASGCAATSAVMHLVKSGEHVIAGDDMYGGSNRLFSKVMIHHGLEFDFVDLRDLNQLESAIKPNTKVIWLETPTNPTLKLGDIAAISKMAKAKGILTVVDNTFASPIFQRPLELGADIVMHSATKYLGGHSDLITGALVVKDQELAEKIAFLSKSMGAIASPFDCYMLSRSLKTLPVRMQRHQENAMEVAKFLESHAAVDKVIYPLLESHPQYQLAREQMSGFSGMMSMEVKGGLSGAKKVLENTQVFLLAESLGGVESLIEHPAIMTHASVPPDQREKLGIGDGFIRLSVGIEAISDLLEDLDQALKASH